jgi:predicted  nucleic acid-binding Zn-ribbon protein
MSDHIPDLTKMIGETPRTDAVEAKCDELELKDAVFYAMFHFAELERELNTANERIKELEAKVDELHDLEKWLEGR